MFTAGYGSDSYYDERNCTPNESGYLDSLMAWNKGKEYQTELNEFTEYICRRFVTLVRLIHHCVDCRNSVCIREWFVVHRGHDSGQ